MKVVSSAKEESLTAEEEKIFNDLELIITKNFKVFYEVGCALTTIRDLRLYRKAHPTFEDYCHARFEISRQSAYQYISAREVMDILSASGGQKLLPLNERQVRPLTRLEPGVQAQAWESAVTSAPDGHITAKHVAEVVAGITGAEVKEKAEKIKKEMEPAVSDNFHNALWTLINVIRDEMRGPLKAKRKKVMIESVQSVERLLAE